MDAPHGKPSGLLAPVRLQPGGGLFSVPQYCTGQGDAAGMCRKCLQVKLPETTVNATIPLEAVLVWLPGVMTLMQAFPSSAPSREPRC
jgi:hypothetical protein